MSDSYLLELNSTSSTKLKLRLRLVFVKSPGTIPTKLELRLRLVLIKYSLDTIHNYSMFSFQGSARLLS